MGFTGTELFFIVLIGFLLAHLASAPAPPRAAEPEKGGKRDGAQEDASAGD